MTKAEKAKFIKACLEIKELNNILKDTQRKRDKLIAITLKEHRIDCDTLNREYRLIAK